MKVAQIKNIEGHLNWYIGYMQGIYKSKQLTASIGEDIQLVANDKLPI